MKITKPETKKFVYDILRFEDDVKNDGAKVPRTTFKKEDVRAYNMAVKKIEESTEIGFIPEGKKREDIKSVDELEWVSYKDQVANPKKGAVTDRFTFDEIELSKDEVNLLKKYYKSRENVDSVTIEVLDEIEEGLGLKK